MKIWRKANDKDIEIYSDIMGEDLKRVAKRRNWIIKINEHDIQRIEIYLNNVPGEGLIGDGLIDMYDNRTYRLIVSSWQKALTGCDITCSIGLRGQKQKETYYVEEEMTEWRYWEMRPK